MYKLYTPTCYGHRCSLIDGTLIRLILGLSAANRRAPQSREGGRGRGLCAAADTRQELRCGVAWKVREDQSYLVEERFRFSGRNFPQVCEGIDTRRKRHYFELVSGNTGASSSRV